MTGSARNLLVVILLTGAVLAVYWPVGRFPFTNFDDQGYVSDNHQVRSGLTRESVAWAFTTRTRSNWHPLTWLSHMVDVELFGMDAGWHHRVNVLIHAANASLLFVALGAATGAPWRSAFAAALFAVHPLHVESVAWIAERKDVLSALFFFLAIAAYRRCAARPGTSRHVLPAAFLALGLLAKPMVVTLPFVLLLLDYWPLRRYAPFERTPGPGVPAFRLVLEKAPLFAMVIVSCVVTYAIQRGSGALRDLPAGVRGINALASYAWYLGKAAWPAGLAVFYPHPSTVHAPVPAWTAAAGGVALAGLTALSLKWMRERPWLAVGWFWFLGTLVPVIGLVQVGGQAMADRYTYLPLVGIFVAVAWEASERLGRIRFGREILAVAGIAAVTILGARAREQVMSWRDSETLFRRALAVTGENWQAHNALGAALLEKGRLDEAAAHFREALRIRPAYPDAAANMGDVMLRQGKPEAALEYYRESLRAAPAAPDVLNKMGLALFAAGSRTEAEAMFRAAVAADPRFPEARYNLANVLLDVSMLDEAIAQYGEALRARPRYADAHNNLGIALARKGMIGEAAVHFREALRLDPGNDAARRNLRNALGP